jgi:protein phosphatase PTC7
MEGVKIYCEKQLSSFLDPFEALKFAHKHTEGTAGSSTACVTALRGNQLLTANLGDSGFLLVREGNLIFRSKEQQYQFNFPYQLSGEAKYSEKVEKAERHSIDVQEGDIIVLGTDGLFDNLFDEQIIKIVKSNPNPKTIANKIANAAFSHASDPKWKSPFNESASNHGYPNYEGGKLDDITVVVAQIHVNESVPVNGEN